MKVVTVIGWRGALCLAALEASACTGSDKAQPRATVSAPGPTVQAPQSSTAAAPLPGSNGAQGIAGTRGLSNGLPATAGTSAGGEFGRVGLGWLNWQLKGDDTAKKMFVGADCELCKSPSMWVVKKKMLD